MVPKGEGSRLTSGRILLVEDHPDTSEFLTRLLHHWDLDIMVANTLEKGLAGVKENSFDTVLSDIGLPDGGGYILISEAKARDEKVLGMALSGYDTASDIEVGKLAGFDHYLAKPFDCEEIRWILGITHRAEGDSGVSISGPNRKNARVAWGDGRGNQGNS